MHAREYFAPLAALAKGLTASGCKVIYRNAMEFKRDQCEDFDLVVASGVKAEAGRAIIEEYEARGVPVLVYDTGRLDPRRVHLGVGKIGWLAPAALAFPNADRFLEMGYPAPLRERGKGLTIFGCAPLDGDRGSSGWSAQPEALKDAATVLHRLGERANRKVAFRPHPHYTTDKCLYPTVNPAEVPFRVSLARTRAALVGGDSGVALHTLLARIPTAVAGGSGIFDGYTVPVDKLLSARRLSEDERVELGGRAALAEFTEAELATPEWAEFVVEYAMAEQAVMA